MRRALVILAPALLVACSKDEPAPKLVPSVSAAPAVSSAPVVIEEPLPPVAPAKIDPTLRFGKKDFAPDAAGLTRPSPWLTDLPRIDAALPTGAPSIVRESWSRSVGDLQAKVIHSIGLVAASADPAADVARIARASGALNVAKIDLTAPAFEPLGDAPKKVNREFRAWGPIEGGVSVQVIAQAVEGTVHVHVDVVHPAAAGEPALETFSRALPEQATLLGLEKLAGKPAEAMYERAVAKPPLARVAYLRVPSAEEEAEKQKQTKADLDIDKKLELAAKWNAKWEAPITAWLRARGFGNAVSPEQWTKAPHFRVVILARVTVSAGRE